MPTKRTKGNAVERVPPAESPSDAVERVSPRSAAALRDRDVVLAREPLPRVNPRPASTAPEWRYRVCVQGQRRSSQFFTSFAPAAAAADQLASERNARLMLVEEGIPSLLSG